MTSTDPVLFISDLHLTPDRPDIFEAFRGFIYHHATKAQALYILGDLFNLWIGDDEPGDFAREVAANLASLGDAGTEVFIMHGNRDFLLGEAYCGDCGASLIPDPHVVRCFDQDFLLMHGDTLCTRDTDYLAFRAMVRDAAWQREFLAKPRAERQAFADQARASSKAMTSNKPEDIMDVTPEEVVRQMAGWGQTVLIHGHTHRPAMHEVDLDAGKGHRIVLGDWDTRGWYLEITPDSLALESFPV